jgi:hypothetical protein
MQERKTIVGRARHAASLVRDFFDVAREVAEWRRERDAFVEMHQLEELRRGRAREHDVH